MNSLTDAWTRHPVGFSRQGCNGQVSSTVVRFDALTGCGVTKSGRVYELAGRPGSDADARYVWARWKSINNVKEERDVSDEVYADILRASAEV